MHTLLHLKNTLTKESALITTAEIQVETNVRFYLYVIMLYNYKLYLIFHAVNLKVITKYLLN